MSASLALVSLRILPIPLLGDAPQAAVAPAVMSASGVTTPDYNPTGASEAATVSDDSDSPKFKCKFKDADGEKCGKEYTTRSRLKRHVRSHSDNPKPYECTFVVGPDGKKCGKRFTARSSLNKHVRSHSDNPKPYECTYVVGPDRKKCGKHFSQDGHRKTHERTHTGEKPYECAFVVGPDGKKCGKRFNENSSLKEHMQRVHSETTF
jgi:uncharacterized Zn-finger protein